MKPLSKDVRECVLVHLDHGLSFRRVAKVAGVSKSAVGKICRAERPNISHLKGGRPKILTPRNEAYLARLAASGEIETAAQAARVAQSQLGKKVSDHTARRAFKGLGLQSIDKKKRPVLPKTNTKALLIIANDRNRSTTRKQRHVARADEAKTDRASSGRSKYYWTRKDISLEP